MNSKKDYVMNRNGKQFVSLAVLLAAGCLLLTVQGCTSRNAKADPKHKPNQPVVNDPEHYFDGGTYCVQTFTQGPPPSQALHFSNKENESDGSSKDFESDLSADKLDVILHQRRKATEADKPGSRPAVDNGPIHVPAMTTAIADGYAETVQTSHYLRSDAHEWSMETSVLAQGGTPWDLFINKPPVTKVGSETISGYETDKYTIDTTHQRQIEKAGLLMAGRLKNTTSWARPGLRSKGLAFCSTRLTTKRTPKTVRFRKCITKGA